MKKYLILYLLTVLYIATPLGAQNFCLGVPKFIDKFGFNSKDHALTTSNKHVTGLTIFNLKATEHETSPFQHESWDDGGNLGHIVRDHKGNCFLIPIPSINTLKNPIEKQNDIYKVDSETGIMRYFMTVPSHHEAVHYNPFGMLGMTFDCEHQCLYAATVMGSDRKNERGRIVQIDIPTKKILSSFEDIDVMGMYTVYLAGQKYLLAGSARRPEVYAIPLDKNGGFAGEAKTVISLEALGPRGDDIARRITMEKNGDIKISGIEFYFNLIAPSERHQTHYFFRFDPETRSFVFLGWQG